MIDVIISWIYFNKKLKFNFFIRFFYEYSMFRSGDKEVSLWGWKSIF
jgi:hypothetical protein